jgi:hypothetical protein
MQEESSLTGKSKKIKPRVSIFQSGNVLVKTLQNSKSADQVKDSAHSLIIAKNLDEIVSIVRKNQVYYDYLSMHCELEHLFNPMRKSTEQIVLDGGEFVAFSELAVKFNKLDRPQERVLVVTNRAIYYFSRGEYKNFKQRIALKDVKWTVFSTNSQEVLIDFVGDFSLRFSFVHRAQFCEMIGKCFADETGKQLLIYLSDLSELKNVVVSNSKIEQSVPKKKVCALYLLFDCAQTFSFFSDRSLTRLIIV